MNLSKDISKKVALFLVALMLTIIPNLEVYSAVGNYQECSMAVSANEGFIQDSDVSDAPALTMMASAVAAAYVFIAYNMINCDDAQMNMEDSYYICGVGGSEEPPVPTVKDGAPDFSKFDN